MKYSVILFKYYKRKLNKLPDKLLNNEDTLWQYICNS